MADFKFGSNINKIDANNVGLINLPSCNYLHATLTGAVPQMLAGMDAGKPDPTTEPNGTLYIATDTAVIYRGNHTAWVRLYEAHVDAQLRIPPDQGVLILSAGDSTTQVAAGDIRLIAGNGANRGYVKLTNLPSSDPRVADAVWRHRDGTLRVSSG